MYIFIQCEKYDVMWEKRCLHPTPFGKAYRVNKKGDNHSFKWFGRVFLS